VSYLLLVLGFLALVKGASLLVAGASSIARRFNISDFAIGMTVVAFGTSTPELFVTLIAALGGRPDIAVGNVIGSNIANTLLILGVTALIRPLAVSRGTVWREMPFGLLASCALLFVAGDAVFDGAAAGVVGRADGLLLLSFFSIFIYYSANTAQRVKGMEELAPARGRSLPRALALVGAGFGGLALGGKWIVDGAVVIAQDFGMSETLVGLTVVAIGTSLPELATSAVAAWKGNSDLALGNVLGSNIFNIYFVLGVTATVHPLPFHAENTMDLNAMVGANLLLFAVIFLGRRLVLARWEGGVLVGCYLAYLAAGIARMQ